MNEGRTINALTTRVEAELYLTQKENGGREKPVFSGYSPEHVFDKSGDRFFGRISFDNQKGIFPGNRSVVTVDFMSSDFLEDCLSEGVVWAIFEGSNEVGQAKLIRIRFQKFYIIFFRNL